MKKIKWIILIVLAVSLLVPPCVNAEYLADEKETLRGIKCVWVGIEPLPANIKELGLTEDIFQTDIELKLRLAGIKILSREERLKTLGMPHLYLNINTANTPPDVIFAWNVSLNLMQEVYLCTKINTSAHATTWTKFYTGYAGKDILEEQLRKKTKDLVDIFLNDYLAVNPKQVDKPKKK